MRIIALKTIKEYWKKEPGSEQALKAWKAEAVDANWKTPADVKAKYGHASILKDGRVIFNIAANKFRLVVWINYRFHTIYIRWVGTHKEYDGINAQII